VSASTGVVGRSSGRAAAALAAAGSTLAARLAAAAAGALSLTAWRSRRDARDAPAAANWACRSGRAAAAAGWTLAARLAAAAAGALSLAAWRSRRAALDAPPAANWACLSGITAAAEAAAVRVVHLRTAVVLARHGGALGKQLPLFRAGVGGRLGSGRQWLSWISLRDEVRAIIHVIGDTSLVGAVNASAPAPVTNRDFTSRLGSVLHRPTVAAVPPVALRLALGRQFADELLLGSLRVLPARLAEAGFRFEDPDIESALHEAVGR